MQDPNMPRWIMASFRTYFETHKLNNVRIFYEGSGRKDISSEGRDLQSYAEFKLNGPMYRRLTRIEESYTVLLNVLCSHTMNIASTDEVETLIGSIFVCFAQSIPIYKFGPADNVANDRSQIGCMIRQTDRDGEVAVARFGQANPDTLFTQASLQAEYRMNLVEKL